MTTSARGRGDATHAYVAKLLRETREELTRADSKAATLFAAVGVTVAVVIGAAASSSADFADLDTKWQVGITAAAVVQAAGLVFLAKALYPSTKKPLRGPVHYYGDVVGYLDVSGTADLAALRQAAEQVSADTVARDLEQFAILAGVVQRKYRFIKLGLLASGVATCGFGVTLLVCLVW